MPELPEVETTRQGIKPHLEGHVISSVKVRNHKFRLPIPENIDELCAGKLITAIERRGKYILLHLNKGYILIHLGMSGHLRIVPYKTNPQKHDHIDMIMNNGLMLRFCDPRRFGLFFYIDEAPYQHPLLAYLGPEPLSNDFNSAYLLSRAQNKSQSIKSFIMDSQIVVGVGNIYATESLFLAQIHPKTPTKKVNEKIMSSLTGHIKNILQTAIIAGGTTLRDFYSFDGKPGYFSVSLKVYGRKNLACFECNNTIETVVIAGRHSAFCPHCQPIIS
ncbi:5-hydroxymethyluracil DNA glycosylase [Legionella norrlandica]|uniref:Formamidopyrimidine-DNA glycosylase n=1 Tax=Legionella norrlandica TaxID=1498499 RepID=A0A0A2SN11_9GAMM|nr:bifunctional DNA-formamidopyrimidine glycosylase/DNA-(apurinic or apyrimidinic site) lyase [Legionella norrlandica]KGP62505.1 5-hydroxymethyluracil DNA glycosylase [Legionella norrlandica]